MKITDIGMRPLQAEQTAGVENRSAQRSDVTRGAAVDDSVQLSDRARLMQKAGQAISEAPDVRPEKVGPIAEAVQQGAYQVNSTKVANSMITNMIQAS